MGVREIPTAFEAACDCCHATETMASKGRPKYWSDFHILRDAYDYQGCAVADGSVKLLLCLKCGEAVTKAVNAAFDMINAASGIEAATADETALAGSAEGESPAAESRDAQGDPR